MALLARYGDFLHLCTGFCTTICFANEKAADATCRRDDVKYVYEDGKNVLTIQKKFWHILHWCDTIKKICEDCIYHRRTASVMLLF